MFTLYITQLFENAFQRHDINVVHITTLSKDSTVLLKAAPSSETPIYTSMYQTTRSQSKKTLPFTTVLTVKQKSNC